MKSVNPYAADRFSDVAIELLGSDVQFMYIALFGRPGDIQGMWYWIHQQEKYDLSRAQIGNAFAESAEFQALHLASASATAQVDAIYLNIYSRHATATELATFAPLLKTAAQPGGNHTLPELADTIIAKYSTDADVYALYDAKLPAANQLSNSLAADATLAAAYHGAFSNGVTKAWLAQVVDSVSAQLAAGQINTLLHDIASTVNPGSVPPSDHAGSGVMTITVPAPHVGVQAVSAITDAHAGETIAFSTPVAATFTAAPLVLPAGATFHAYLDSVAAGAHTNMGWFQYENNTYLVATQPKVGTHTGFIDGTDSVVKLAGLIDLSGATLRGGGLLLNAGHGGDGVINVVLPANIEYMSPTFASIPVQLAAGATLDDYMNAAATGMDTEANQANASGNGIVEAWFQFGGNTYVVESYQFQGHALAMFDPAVDTVVKMTGLYELSNITLPLNGEFAHGLQFSALPGDSGAITITISTPGATAASYATVSDIHAGEIIALGATAAAHFTPAALSLPSPAGFRDYLNGAAAGVGSQEGWFQFGGDTYLVATEAAPGAARSTFIDGTDFVVKLPGLVDLSGASLGQNGLLLNNDHAASHAMTITVPLMHENMSIPVISDAHKGETIGFEAAAPAHFNSAQVAMQFSDPGSYEDAAVAGVGSQEGWFQYYGDTYLVASQASPGEQHPGFDPSTDFAVRLTGLYDLSGATVGANGITLTSDRIDVVYAWSPSLSSADPVTIPAAHAGQLIVFGTAEVAGHFASAAVMLAAGAGLHDYLDAAAAGVGNQEGWFQYQGNTYLVASETHGESHKTFMDGTDFFVKLTGLVDLSHAILGPSGLTLH